MLLRLAAVVVVGGFSVSTSVLVTPPALPVMVTLVALLTAEATALKLPELAPATIVTADGTCSAALLLVKVTLVALLAASLRDAVHVLDSDPVSDCVPHTMLLRLAAVAVVFGSSVITSVLLTPSALAVMVTLVALLTAEATTLKPPDSAPSAIVIVDGTCKAELLLLKLTLIALLAAALRVTVQAFDSDPVNDCVPQETLLKLADVVVVFGSSVITSVFVTPSALAVMVTFVVLLTADETASKPADSAPAAIVTADGTCRAELLLLRLTFVGELAAALKYTEHVFD